LKLLKGFLIIQVMMSPKNIIISVRYFVSAIFAY